MAILSVTAANVGVGSTATRLEIVQVGESMSHASTMYYNTTDGKYYKGDADTAGAANVSRIAITSASADGYVVSVINGPVAIGATLTTGTAYYASTTAGGIDTESALASGDFVTYLGIAISTTLLDFQPDPSGVAKP